MEKFFLHVLIRAIVQYDALAMQLNLCLKHIIVNLRFGIFLFSITGFKLF